MHNRIVSMRALTLALLATATVGCTSPIANTQSQKAPIRYQSRIPVRANESLPQAILLRVDRDVPADSIVRLKASSASFLRSVALEGVQLDNGHDCEILHRFSREEMSKNWSWHINTMPMAAVRISEPIKAGSHLRVILAETAKSTTGKKTKGEPRLPYSGLTSSIEAGVIDNLNDSEFKPLSEPVVFEFLPGPVTRMEAYLKPDGLVRVSWLDAFGNTATPAETAVTCTAVNDQRIAFGNASVQAPSGADRVTVKDSSGLTAVSNARPITMDGTPIWFGEFHWHTNFSGDGQNTIEAGLRNARDGLGLDFAGPGDHIDTSGNYHHGLKPKDQAQQCLPFEQPGRFAIIAGAELSQRFGHANIYAVDFPTFAEITDKFKKTFANIHKGRSYPHSEMASLCPPGRALYIPHHTNTSSGAVLNADSLPLWYPMTWPVCGANEALRLVEICQVRGTFETEEIDKSWGMQDRGGGGSVQTALTRGYRIGFVAGTDNHNGWPTRGPNGPVAVTAVQSTKLDQKSIFDALYQRRCYATSGARIVADATLNGHPMGSEIKLRPGAPRVIKIAIKGTKPVLAVQIIHNGIVLADLPVKKQTLDFTAEWSDTRPFRALDNAYYYVRARQADGHRVWLSPWWIDADETPAPAAR